MTATSTLANSHREPPTERRTGEGLDRAARRLSVLVGVLMVIAAGSGAVFDDVYREDNDLRSMLRGHDFVTLLVVVPMLTLSLVRAGRGRGRARLVWLGTLAFTTYNYAVYVLGTGFNVLFLVHAALLETAAVALVLGLLSTHSSTIPSSSRRASRIAASLLLFLAVGLGVSWLFNALRFAVTGDTPVDSQLQLPLSSVHLGYALDLMLIVPSYAFAAVLLWRREDWGKVLAPVLLVGGLLQQLAYMAALVAQFAADLPGATGFDPGEPMVVLAYAGALVALLRRPRPTGTPGLRLDMRRPRPTPQSSPPASSGAPPLAPERRSKPCSR